MTESEGEAIRRVATEMLKQWRHEGSTDAQIILRASHQIWLWPNHSAEFLEILSQVVPTYQPPESP